MSADECNVVLRILSGARSADAPLLSKRPLPSEAQKQLFQQFIINDKIFIAAVLILAYL